MKINASLKFGLIVSILLIGFGFSKDAGKIKSNQADLIFASLPDSSSGADFFRDIYPDTWVATDELGRSMPGFAEVGPVKNGQRRVVGMFYVTWHTQDNYKMNSPFNDVTKTLSQAPEARVDAGHPLWNQGMYHWGEPEMGYFLSQDEFVIRKDMSMLADAGIDVLIMDVTNAVRYWDEWDVLFRTMEKMKEEGNKVPQFCFWAFNGPVITVVQELYERIYQAKKFSDLWFYWDGKPLLLYNGDPTHDANGKGVLNPNPHYDSSAKTDKNHPHYNDPGYTEENYLDYTREVKEFFTLRTMWWGYYTWGKKRFVGTEDNWSFGYDLGDEKVKAMNPDELVSLHNGKKEEAAVTPAQHPISLTGKSWSRKQGEPVLNQYDMPDSAYVPWLGKTVKNPEGYGIYFQERWDETLKSDPQFIYINDWNEWTAGKYQRENGEKMDFMRRENPFFFVDQYNAEFNRTIQPMKGGYSDNYYMQMAQNIRRYKGIRPIPVLHGFSKIKVDGNFDDWAMVKTEYRDTKGDISHRDSKGYAGLHYTNNSGRNDFVTCKTAVDKDNIYFYAETAGPLTPSTGNNWMLLLADTDNNPETGWYGYDFMINQRIIDQETTVLKRFDESSTNSGWADVANLPYRYAGNRLELAVPRKMLGLAEELFTFDFKWSDNPAGLDGPVSFCINGDTAPNRRFNYRCIWKK